MHLVFGDACFVIVWIFFYPVRMFVGFDFTRRLSTLVDRWLTELKTADPVRANRVGCQRRVPRTLVGTDRTPVFQNHMNVAF